MNVTEQLAQERRARLAAERLLALKQTELSEANRKLSLHARALSEEVVVKREETAVLRGENEVVRSSLKKAEVKASVAEQRLWEALQTVKDGFALFDADNRLAIANNSYLSIFDGLDLIRPGTHYDDIAAVLVEEGIVDTQGEPPRDYIARLRTRWRDEEPAPEVIRLWNGQFVKLIDRRTPDGGTVSLGLNITEMMRMWAAVETIPDGFVLYDQDDRLVMCNQRYREIYPDSAPAIVEGRSFEEIVRYGLDRGQFHDAIGREDEWLEERMALHRAADTVLEQRLGDGRWLRIFEHPTPDGGRVGLRVDVTDMKEQQEALRVASERAEAANRAKSAFLANMSHEIRTPMNGVVGMADLLAESDLSDEQKLYVETIKHSGESLLVIINDVLDYSKIEAERLTLHPEPFDLELCIHEVAMLLQPIVQEKGIELVVDYDMFLATRFIGDPGRIRQVLTNLIGNAVKFTSSGHVLVRVVGLPVGDDAQRVHLTVEDTGIGIPQEMTEHIFGEFNQIEDDRNRSFEGTGLGLAITRQLVALMGGEIWVESEEGQGSCFGFHLTMQMAEDDEANIPPLSPSLRIAAVVDCHDAHRVTLCRQIGALGLQVRDYYDAETFLQDRQTVPDIAIFHQDVISAEAISEAYPSAHLLLIGSSAASARLAVESGQVAGSLFTPLLRRDLVKALAGIAGNMKAETQTPADAPARRMRVLAAEDNRTNQLVFSKMVKTLNIELQFANNGREALEQYESFRPDLIFMDISMPEVDGKEATRRIRTLEAQGKLPRVPIVALTAHAMSGDAEDILAVGLDHYLTKPLHKAAIHERILAAAPSGTEAIMHDSAAVTAAE